MIDEKKLIEALKNESIGWGSGRPYEDGVFDGLQLAVLITKDQPQAGQWIPCSERLPKKAHSYVVTEQTKDGRYIMNTRIFRGGKWVIEELYDDVKVIAWMSAEPYKGGSR